MNNQPPWQWPPQPQPQQGYPFYQHPQAYYPPQGVPAPHPYWNQPVWHRPQPPQPQPNPGAAPLPRERRHSWHGASAPQQPPQGLLRLTRNLFNPAGRNARYPDLNPILASDMTFLRCDVRQQPEQAIMAHPFYEYRHQSAFREPRTHVRLISKDFPWTIDVKPRHGPVACADIWKALHRNLQEHLADSEWGLILDDQSRRETLEKAMKRRVEAGDDVKVLKRVDWLGKKIMFKGLEKDDEFAQRRLLPGTESCPETWVVRLAADG